ncbi:MAG: NAD(P)H-hydrate dehydratase [Phycisphaerales bacterium]
MTTAMPRLPSRDPSGHKGSFGTVAVVGGCLGDTTMLGAPLLAGLAALRSGVGLCRLVLPESLLPQALSQLWSATGVGFTGVAPTASEVSADAAVIGPGLGRGSAEAVTACIKDIGAPRVIDADGLNALAATAASDGLTDSMLTPHPGEASRLARALGVEIDLTAESGRREAALRLADRTGATVVLKGSGTVVADAGRVWICTRGHACLATGGTGDVLAGLLGGLLAQSVAGGWELSRFHLACIAVESHARAGELWASRRGASAGMLARELADLLPECLESMRGR